MRWRPVSAVAKQVPVASAMHSAPQSATRAGANSRTRRQGLCELLGLLVLLHAQRVQVLHGNCTVSSGNPGMHRQTTYAAAADLELHNALRALDLHSWCSQGKRGIKSEHAKAERLTDTHAKITSGTHSGVQLQHGCTQRTLGILAACRLQEVADVTDLLRLHKRRHRRGMVSTTKTTTWTAHLAPLEQQPGQGKVIGHHPRATHHDYGSY